MLNFFYCCFWYNYDACFLILGNFMGPSVRVSIVTRFIFQTCFFSSHWFHPIASWAFLANKFSYVLLLSVFWIDSLFDIAGFIIELYVLWLILPSTRTLVLVRKDTWHKVFDFTGCCISYYLISKWMFLILRVQETRVRVSSDFCYCHLYSVISLICR